MTASAVRRVGRQIGGQLRLPPVAVRQQLFLVVHQLFPAFDRELEIRSLHDRIDRASFLAQPAIDALRHVDVIAGGATATVGARLGLYRDRESWANGFAKLAGNAALLAIGVAPQRMLPPEARAERTLLVRIVDRHPRTKQIPEGKP